MNQQNNFLALSAILTGFSQDVISSLAYNVATLYFDKFKQEISIWEEILNKYESLSSQKNPALTDEQIGHAILNDKKHPEYEMPCRQLIFLWYSGAWGVVQQVTKNGKTKDIVVSDLLSGDSYTQGLAWQVMQSHPMGDSNYRYGYWAEAPAPLSGYTGNKND